MLLCIKLCCISSALSQFDGPTPPRINIPGAIPLPAVRPHQLQQQQQQGRQLGGQPVRVRKPARPQPPQEQPQQLYFDSKPVNEEPEDEHHFVPSQPAPPSPPRALFTSEPQEADHAQSNAQRFNLDRPKAVPQQRPQQYQQQQQQAQPQKPRAQTFEDRAHQKPHHSDDKPKKPVAQILRKYREEHPDGSITWGFENDDGKLLF